MSCEPGVTYPKRSDWRPEPSNSHWHSYVLRRMALPVQTEEMGRPPHHGQNQDAGTLKVKFAQNYKLGFDDKGFNFMTMFKSVQQEWGPKDGISVNSINLQLPTGANQK